MSILVASGRPEQLEPFLHSLAASTGREIALAPSGAQILDWIPTHKPVLVVIDEGLPDLKPLDLVREILMVSAMTLTAVITALSEDDFHEEAEGYGVLMALPTNPTATDGTELARRLATV